MLPKLEVRHLAVLVALAETGSVTGAAPRLGLTQSAVSHRLREAERRTGTRLVERYERGVRLTAAGERLRATADTVLRELARAERAIQNEAGETVRLGQATYSRYHWLPDFLTFLAGLHPQLEVDLSGTAAAKPFAALNAGTVDVVTIYGREIAPGRYRWQKLGIDPLVAVIAPTHRLARQPHLEAADIAGERYFAYPLSAEPGYEWEALIGHPSVPFRRVTHMPTPEAVIDLVRAGFGVGVFSRWAVEPEVADGTLVAIPITSQGLILEWWAVSRATEDEDSPATQLANALVTWSARPDRGLATLGFEAGQDD